MQINDLYLKDGIIYRIIYISKKLLVVNCIIRSLPYWTTLNYFIECQKITQSDLERMTSVNIISDTEATKAEKQKAEEIWRTISNIVLFIYDDVQRKNYLNHSRELYGVSRSTIRKRLCDYLTYQTINIFIPKRKKDKELTKDEKNFRWALNKYYYNPIKMSLIESYRRMLKDKYCDEFGNLVQDFPTYRQYRYFYKKTNTIEKEIISREGKGEFMRNHRALLGNGIRDFCPSIGYGMLDSTVLDVYLINEKGEVLGRPIMTACIDGYSSMCLGYSLGFEGGINSLVTLVDNILTDKQEHCLKFGIDIDINDWNCNELPRKIITDRGGEYVGDRFSQLAELGIEMINLEPFRPDLKGMVEQFFNIIQNYYKGELYYKGGVMSDSDKRGSPDYVSRASLTISEFEKIIILCILKYNSKRIIDLPYDLIEEVRPFASELWNYSKLIYHDNLIAVKKELAYLTLLPRVEGTIRRNGLKINKLRYKNYEHINKYLNEKKKVTVAYDPLNVSKVWVIDNNEFIPFEVIDSFFVNKSIEEVKELTKRKTELKREAYDIEIQTDIDLIKDIEKIAHNVTPMRVDKKNIRKHRRNEIRKLGIKNEHGKY